MEFSTNNNNNNPNNNNTNTNNNTNPDNNTNNIIIMIIVILIIRGAYMEMSMLEAGGGLTARHATPVLEGVVGRGGMS